MARCQAPNAAPLEDSLDQLVRRGTMLIDEIRRVRAERQLKPRDEVILHVGGETLALINGLDGLVERLAGVSEISADAAPATAAGHFEGQSFAIQTSGGLDPAAERPDWKKRWIKPSVRLRGSRSGSRTGTMWTTRLNPSWPRLANGTRMRSVTLRRPK